MIILPEVLFPGMVESDTDISCNNPGDEVFDISALDAFYLYGREIEEDNLVIESGYLCDRHGNILNWEYCLTLNDLSGVRGMLSYHRNAGPFIIMPATKYPHDQETFSVSEIISLCRIIIVAQAVYLFDRRDSFLENMLNQKGCPAALVTRKEAPSVIGVFLSH